MAPMAAAWHPAGMPRRSANADPADPAPALSRGIALLERLASDGPQVLERLAASAGLPKSSTLRLLSALERLGLVARDPATRRFHARAVLTRGQGDAAETAHQRTVLAGLARAAGHAAELWELRSDSLVLTDRADPEDASTAVRARIGFVRPLVEADAVALIAFACAGATLPRRHTQSQKRSIVPLGRALVNQQIQACRTAGCAADAGLNAYGVRRFAAPWTGPDGRCRILAVAQGGGVPPGEDDDRLLRLVAQAAR